MSVNSEIQYTLTVLTQDIEDNSRKLETSLVRIMGYLQQMTGNADIRNFLNLIQDSINALRTFQITLAAVEAASGPVGWLYAGVSAVAAGYAVTAVVTDVQTTVYSESRGYS